MFVFTLILLLLKFKELNFLFQFFFSSQIDRARFLLYFRILFYASMLEDTSSYIHIMHIFFKE